MNTAAFELLDPIPEALTLKVSVYKAIREAIGNMDIYSSRQPLKLDERMLAKTLGVSRTPVREAISLLEQEGLVKTHSRHGTFVVRKNKSEILEIVYVWAGLESVAARLATKNASDDEIESLRRMFVTFEGRNVAQAKIDEYSKTNIEFHKRLIELSRSELLNELTDRLFMHMRAIRRTTIGERDRAVKSVIDHMRIIHALEVRDACLAERLVREHAMNLAMHIEMHVDYLD